MLKKHVFGSLNLNNSEIFGLSFEDIFLGTLDTSTKKMNPPSAVLGGGVHGKVCWLIAYHSKSDVTRIYLQWRVQEFVGGGGGRKSEKLFFAFQYSRGGAPAQKIADKMIFPTKKVAKYRWNSLKFALMTFFFAFQFLGRGGGAGPLAPPGHAPDLCPKNIISWSSSYSIV